jgi:hypothetical protein
LLRGGSVDFGSGDGSAGTVFESLAVECLSGMLTRETILTALQLVSERLRAKNVVGEINFAPVVEMREAAGFAARELGLPPDWLNDAVKGFASHRPRFKPAEGVEFSNLRIQTPVPEYLLAMKVMVARAGIAGQRGDAEDIEFLIRHLNLQSAEQVLSIVQEYYLSSKILPRSMYLVDEIFEHMASSHEEGS